MDHEDHQRDALEQANAKLRASLEQCRVMVADYRDRLAVNLNLPEAAEDESNSADRNG